MNTKSFVAGCFMVAVITVWKQYAVSTERVLPLAGLSVEIFLIIWTFFPPAFPLAIPRGLRSLQWQSVRLQSTCPWSSYSGGPTSADHAAGDMHIEATILFGASHNRTHLNFHFFLWLLFCFPATVSVASSVAGSQEDPEWPHQQPIICAH